MTPLKVLLVDDEALARMRLRTLLQDCSDPASEIIGEAGDAGTALALLREQPCDLVLLDIGLPGLDGLQLAGRLQAQAPAAMSHPAPAPPSVVFVTAHADHALTGVRAGRRRLPHQTRARASGCGRAATPGAAAAHGRRPRR
jgi:two-component system, LytTR family, response regulator AlgR